MYFFFLTSLNTEYLATSIFFGDCFLLKSKSTRNLKNCQSQNFLMAQIYKQFDAGVIKILLLFPIWNLKAILTKYYFSS